METASQNLLKESTENQFIRFIRPDIPQTIQVGLIVNPGMPPHDGEGQFSHISFERIGSFAQCQHSRLAFAPFGDAGFLSQS